MVAAFAAAMLALGISPILVILLAALLGLMLYKSDSPPRLTVSSVGASSFRKAGFDHCVSGGFGVRATLFIRAEVVSDLAAIMFRIDLFAFGGGFASCASYVP